MKTSTEAADAETLTAAISVALVNVALITTSVGLYICLRRPRRLRYEPIIVIKFFHKSCQTQLA